MAEQVKVAILEERLQNFEAIVTKLDSAIEKLAEVNNNCLLYTSPSPRDRQKSRMPSSA